MHEKENGDVDILTKGDNNAVDDRGLYAASQSWINKEHVIGRAKGYLYACTPSNPPTECGVPLRVKGNAMAVAEGV